MREIHRASRVASMRMKTEHEALAVGVNRMIWSPHASDSTVKTRVRCFYRVMTVFWSIWIVDYLLKLSDFARSYVNSLIIFLRGLVVLESRVVGHFAVDSEVVF